MSEDQSRKESPKDLRPILEEISGMTEEQKAELIYDSRREAARDELTGLLNKKAWMVTTGSLIEQNKRLDRKLGVSSSSIMVVDLDGFKDINDNLGHSFGDVALITFSDLFKENISRGSDVLGRWGGDEFMAFLSRTSLEEANKIKEKILLSLVEIEALLEGNPFSEYPLKASIGVIEIGEDETITQALARADKIMYQVKKER